MSSPRRGSRMRRKPTPIYQTEDTRVNGEESTANEEQQDAVLADERGEDSSDEEPHADDDEEFAPCGTRAPSTAKAAQTPSSNARPSRRKRSPWSQTRSSRSAQGSRRTTKSAAAQVKDLGIATGPPGSDSGPSHDNGISLFEAVKGGKASLEKLLSEWRERFEHDSDRATKEVLELVLQACGSTSSRLGRLVSVAELDLEDVTSHVQEDLDDANGEYWIMSRGRGIKKFQRHFEEFWEAFVNECYESDLLFTSDVVTKFVDWLTVLSRSELRPIRHTSAVAILALSVALVRTAASISEQLAIAKRQLKAETNSPVAATPGSARKSPNVHKVALLKDNEALYENRLQQVLKLVNSIFTEVVVHRYRDVMPEIRVVSVQCLGHWITILPDHFLKDNFLKYLGWCLSDKAASVRLEVVAILCELYEKDAFTERLELFNSRFLPRYMELCNDVDNAVVEESIHLLIAIDKHSLISSDVELPAVEKLVFDAERDSIRKVAAEFVCLQYDAFGIAVSKTKNAQLKKEQLNTQAIALVEFAEEYIQSHGIPESAVETLVDAFWELDDCLVLRDWRLMTDLLLVDKSAPDLSCKQQTILLRLLVASVSKLVENSTNRGAGAATKRESEQLQEEITVAYCKDIPSLFVMYQADSDKLSLLLQLIPMLSLKSEIIGHHSNHVKELLEKLKHAFLLHSDEELLSSLSLSVAHLLQTEHTSLKREVEATMHELVQEIMDKLDRLLESDLKLYDTFATAGDGTPTTRNKGARSGKKKSATVKQLSDVEYALRIALCRLKCLVRHVNIRGYIPPDSSSILDKTGRTAASDPQQGQMEKLVRAIGDLLCRRTRSVSELHEEFRHLDTIKHGLTILFFDLLWITLPIFETAAEKKTRDSSGNTRDDAEAKVDLSTQVQIQEVCRSRSTLEEALISVLEMHLARPDKARDDKHERTEEASERQLMESMEEMDFEGEDVAVFVDDAQSFAFITFCDARCLFVEKFQEATAPYDALDWTLPKVLVLLTQTFFERKMDEAEEREPEYEDDVVQNDPAMLKEKMDAMREWDQKQQRKAELLVALGRVTLCNPSKKHQAAAVLQYFTSSGKLSVEVVKAYGKQVKADAPVRYLEIQMTSLRQLYSSILLWKQNIEAAEPGNDSDQVSEEDDLQDKVNSSKQELKELARRFSQSLGVGKVSASLRVPFLRFLREGIRYALEQPTQFEFLEAMRVYLTHLDKPSMAQLSAYFIDQLQRVRDTRDGSGELDPRWRAVLDFQSSISSTGSTIGKTQMATEVMHSPPLKSKLRSASSEPTPMQTTSIAEEVEDENTRDEGKERESIAGNQSDLTMTADGSKVDHDHRQERSVHEVNSAADDNTKSTQSLQNRKRPRDERIEKPVAYSNVSKQGGGESEHRTVAEQDDGAPSRSDQDVQPTKRKERGNNEKGAEESVWRSRRKRPRA
ncbi:unnamed protein product [Hyaloperonospora brassicae]|uniref:SCD domain-containing protein n=1 Tax=Hyaloperonospora brassicae TaxID=162125 RepID=A0AAV0TTW7_HYABA|nr:unnamed protein product [Hyaloperonospora brassicae]